MRCPCCSEKEYSLCCQPLHQGAQAKSALELMRSRYSAYALNLPDYLIATTHPASPHYLENKFSWRRSLTQSAQESTFQKLEIHDFQENETLAAVTFTATVLQGGEDATFTERSYFEKINKRWYYRGGILEKGRTPHLVRRLNILPMAYYGDAVLRKKAEPIAEITEEIKHLVEKMVETMDSFGGLGLAAPQIHHSLRIFVIHQPIASEKGYTLGDIRVFINPKLSYPSPETWKAPEGCLSIPTIRAEVMRPKEITVEYTSLEGNVHTERVSGWEARVIMHEHDHINGTLFIDRLAEDERTELKPRLNNLEKRIRENK